MSQYPIAPKTQAAGVSAAVAGAILYVLQQYAFRGAVPAGIESLIYASVPGLVAFAAAWLAPHQARPQPLTFTRPYVSGPSNVTVTGSQPPMTDEEAAALRDKIRAGYPLQAGKPGEPARPGPLPVLPDSAYAPGAVPLERLAAPGDQEPPKPGM